MSPKALAQHRHDHVFGQDRMRAGERRTAIVVAITAVMMVVEVAAGVAFGSMALLADGLHMASHAVALGVTLGAYLLARRYAGDARFGFGTGKVSTLAAFASAVLLAGFAALMAFESAARLIDPVTIQFDQAIAVAVLGLLVNGASALLLGHDHGHDAGGVEIHGSDDHHGHTHEEGHDHDHALYDDRHHHHHHDHNLRAAYFHVLADALTSLLAIVALLAGKLAGWSWLDPVMGIVGAILIARWAWGLLRQSGSVLLDQQAPEGVLHAVRCCIEASGSDQVADLHVWSIGPGIRAAELVIVSTAPLEPAAYKARLPAAARIVHVAVEVHKAAVPERPLIREEDRPARPRSA
jgi:cation diffusion facilitator family transporter